MWLPILLAAMAVGISGKFAGKFNGTRKGKQYIVGGELTPLNRATYQLSLEHHGTHVGGASVISERWALTAAHCVVNVKRPSNIRLRSGTQHRGAGGYLHQVVQMILHQGFDLYVMDYDVAVLRVLEPFKSQFVINLSLKKPPTGTTAVVSGWGHVFENGPPSDHLRWVNVLVVEQAKCIELNAAVRIQITNRMFCAGIPNGGRDACQGDSGGPLVAGGLQIGIVSQGKGCARIYQGIYTDIAEVHQWIMEKTSEKAYY